MATYTIHIDNLAGNPGAASVSLGRGIGTDVCPFDIYEAPNRLLITSPPAVVQTRRAPSSTLIELQLPMDQLLVIADLDVLVRVELAIPAMRTSVLFFLGDVGALARIHPDRPMRDRAAACLLQLKRRAPKLARFSRRFFIDDYLTQDEFLAATAGCDDFERLLIVDFVSSIEKLGYPLRQWHLEALDKLEHSFSRQFEGNVEDYDLGGSD